MRHVDEGRIHAWLDDQVTDPAEAAWIERHLGECELCRALLATERETFDSAQALLARTAPPADGPTFESLVARASRSTAVRGTDVPVSLSRNRWLIPAAWAASLALAVGIGWAARALTGVEPDRQVAMTEPRADIATEPGRNAGTDEASPTPQPQSVSSPAAVAPRQPGPESHVDAAPAPLESLESVTEAPTVEAPAPRAPAPVPVEPAADEPWRELPRTEAAARTGMPLYGIDGLALQSTALSADGAVVRTLYRLASGQVVELVQQRAAPGKPPALADTPAALEFAGSARPAGVSERRAATQRTWSNVRDGVRLTLHTTADGTDLNELGLKLRVD